MNSRIIFTTKGTNSDSVFKSFIVAIICLIIGLIMVFLLRGVRISPYRGSDGERAFAIAFFVIIRIVPFLFAVLAITKAIIDNLRYIELYEDHLEGRKLAMNNYGYNDIYLKFNLINSVSVEKGCYICINAGGAIYKARSSKAKEFMQVYYNYVNSISINI